MLLMTSSGVAKDAWNWHVTDRILIEVIAGVYQCHFYYWLTNTL